MICPNKLILVLLQDTNSEGCLSLSYRLTWEMATAEQANYFCWILTTANTVLKMRQALFPKMNHVFNHVIIYTLHTEFCCFLITRESFIHVYKKDSHLLIEYLWARHCSWHFPHTLSHLMFTTL